MGVTFDHGKSVRALFAWLLGIGEFPVIQIILRLEGQIQVSLQCARGISDWYEDVTISAVA